MGRLEDWRSSPTSTIAPCSTWPAKAPKPPSTTCSASAARRSGRASAREKDEPWFAEHLDALPAAYLNATPPQQAAADLRLLHGLASRPGRPRRAAACRSPPQYQPETATVQFTVATSERITPGIFHKLTGALSSHGLEIRSAQIHTLPDGLVLDRFWVHDPDYAGEPPPQRLDEVQQSLVESLTSPTGAAAGLPPHVADGRRIGRCACPACPPA